MGYGALISGLVSAGMQLYKGLSGQSQQSRMGVYASQLRNQADVTLQPFTDQGYWNMDIPGMAQQSINFGLANAPQVNQSNMQQLQSLLGQALPGYQGMVSQATANTQSLLAGNVPTDVQNQIRMSAAAQTLQSGAFAGGAPTGALTARDLGLTSLNLQQQGFSQMQGLTATARNYLMPQPVNPLSLLPLTDLISGNEWSKTQTFNASAQYYNARANALAAQFGGPQTSNIGTIGQALQTGLGALTAKNPQTNQTGWGQIMSLFGMGGQSGLDSGSTAGAGYNMPDTGTGSYGSLGPGD